jgi:hypothetical protein
MPDLQTMMKRNSVYVAFVLGGALVGEKVSNSGIFRAT